ncbi:MAG: sulfatase [Planctomycetales bacterium]|nr:sulfatase [Planctomycetales bacterium]
MRLMIAVLSSLFLTNGSLAQRPNIVWIIADDMSANFSCYGETSITTPNVDRLAAKGVKFTNAYVTAPVCSTCRSAFITGMYQTSIGAQHHRSGRGLEKLHLPERVQLVPELLQEVGYYTTLSGWPITGNRLGKSDYNFEWDLSVYDGNDWSKRTSGQPFFAQIMTQGGKLRGDGPDGWRKVADSASNVLGSSTSHEAVHLPPYYPPHPDIIQDWAAYLDAVRLTDVAVGEVVARLEREGVLNNTLVLFMTDHGISHARGKQFLYDEGIHIPLVVRGPEIPAGMIRSDLVEHIDIAALTLAAAGVGVPEWMQARDILASDYVPRQSVFSARDRCDETVDCIRSTRTSKFKYIRNFLPQRPYLQPCAYKDSKQILIALRNWHSQGKLDVIQELLFQETRPPEELYNLHIDPFEVHNVAADPDYSDVLASMRRELAQWMERTSDAGQMPEPVSMYDSDMAVYLEAIKRRREPAQVQTIKGNIQLMKQLAAEGK